MNITELSSFRHRSVKNVLNKVMEENLDEILVIGIKNNSFSIYNTVNMKIKDILFALSAAEHVIKKSAFKTDGL